MSQETFALDAARRDDQGKGASRRLRREGRIPAIVYGGDEAPQSVTILHNEILKHLEHEAFYSHVLELNIDGKTSKVILRDLHRHPYKPLIMHADFQRVSANQSLRVTVPLHFLNKETSVGAKAGGIVNVILSEIEVDCTANKLPEFIEVDMKDLDIGGSIHLSQIKMPAGVRIHALMLGEDHDVGVVAIHAPKVDKSAEAESEE
ncbi:50S ribosomal protein L25/general stress protein Ctc [Halothiobacillus neapolitanus]|jgi:large subunit ribosomal protein L25|uniref:Large ribosomal subunit protein bL25 n=1 Tax=Halothiobacillus neapolitanus (strain ATCC 23641 / DSM 15147 / CIP 104769 / NCIMB 8539 / c2) TaxID=555778 RepID=D0KZY2_HALNC|nr:50S ribosomal protein L25/general stress protein Ctc [Halothiobacillus neapolitanus]ACX96005.1 ribosomal 5S rRNA E-loop binding protein Ctc/L25/TL5 [Halothiobacillus neapolitanus c2]OZB73673.1 MAG: 50S ribosomal protein L25/general stress protein Ctc [Halothiobacillus sp. 14-55-98]TDN66312.1 LSU ribosomal protein L25P [Halothiobacillus neapolitanus]